MGSQPYAYVFSYSELDTFIIQKIIELRSH